MPHARQRFAPFLVLLAAGAAFAFEAERRDAFRQLDELLPTPNVYRTASGAPGHAYWQQQVDYAIDVTLDDEARRILGSERVTYHNNSPDTLRYLWVQLDPNIFSPQAHAVTTRLAPSLESTSYTYMEAILERERFDGSVDILDVRTGDGATLEHTVVDTMMRLDLPEPLASGTSVAFEIDWSYAINDTSKVRGRTGFEFFEEDGNCIYELAQWFPRLAAYTDVNGWQNKPYLGSGEFALEFGDYAVAITVPDDHVVAATGVLQNPDEVLDPLWRDRLQEARTSDVPLFIVTPEEALENEGSTPSGTKTWRFEAENVRDYAFASSRKFIWDAKLQDVEGRDVWAMSYYPNEGEPLWSRYSTQAILHTLDVYSKHAFSYPYPVAISVNGPVGGMEYPMLCFNGPRPEKDGTYSKRTKYGLISVVIHEVGHNWFPMIVNSDERQWTWMDEGLNTFLQYLAEQAWEENYPSRSGEPQRIVGYMKGDRQVPIMTNADSLLQSGSNAYAKPATALNILRETVMGRELFDFAFREYATRWRFKRPEPADLFRTLEDASAVDLDWFFRGWFFTTDHADLALVEVEELRIDTQNPEIERPLARAERDERRATVANRRNTDLARRIAAYPELADFYNTYDDLDITPEDLERYASMREGLDEDQLALLDLQLSFYVVHLENEGGLVMPVVLELQLEDGTTEERRVPAELWRRNDREVTKLLITEQPVTRIELDPHREIADADRSDNVWPPEMTRTSISLSKRSGRSRSNPMREAREAEEKREAEAAAALEAEGEQPADVEASGEGSSTQGASRGEAPGTPVTPVTPGTPGNPPTERAPDTTPPSGASTETTDESSRRG